MKKSRFLYRHLLLAAAVAVVTLTPQLPAQEGTKAEITHTISGTIVLNGAYPLVGVTLSGLPGSPVTGAYGNYSATVSDSWSGTVTPTLSGFTFSPVSRTYVNVGSDLTSQIYTATESVEPNDDPATATLLALGADAGFIYVDGEAEWYKFYVPPESAGQDLRVNVRVTSAYPDPIPANWRSDLDFQLFDGTLRMLGMATSGSDNETLYLHDVASGWYYITIPYCTVDYADASFTARYSIIVEAGTGFGLGYVTGQVVDGSGAGVENVFIYLEGVPFDWNVSRPYMTSGPDGYFTIAYGAGSYTATFTHENVRNSAYITPPNVVGEFYNDKKRKADADTITFAGGETVNLGVVALETGAIVSGRVTDLSANPLANASVYGYDAEGLQRDVNGYVYTDADGYFTLNGLPPGGAKLRFNRTGYALEYYNDKPTIGSADSLPTVAGETISEVNAQLGVGGIISGTVTNGTGGGIVGVKVTLYPTLDSVNSRTYVTITNPAGTYTLGRLLPGDYKIFFDTTGVAYLPEWYNDAATFAAATPVSVTQGGSTTGINATLQSSLTVSGTVTAGGSGLPGVTMGGLPGSPLTDAAGAYSVKVAANWSGTVTPSLDGYTFAPVDRVYTTIAVDQPNQDYAALLVPALELTAPNGGENWRLGSDWLVTWNAGNIQGFGRIDLLKNGVLAGTIARKVPLAAGFFRWIAGAHSGGTAAAGSDYRVRIVSNDQIYADQSDAAFTLSSAAGVTLIAPHGGENWALGASRRISWAASGLSGTCRLELWKDGAKVGTILASQPVNAGYYDWVVGNYVGGTAPAGGGFTVKVVTTDNLHADESDNDFAIVAQPFVSLTAPNGGESWPLESTRAIAWSSANVGGSCRLELLKAGVKVGDIATGVSVSAGSYSWSVGHYVGGTVTAGSDYTVRLVTAGTIGRALFSDASNGYFSVTAAEPLLIDHACTDLEEVPDPWLERARQLLTVHDAGAEADGGLLAGLERLAALSPRYALNRAFGVVPEGDGALRMMVRWPGKRAGADGLVSAPLTQAEISQLAPQAMVVLLRPMAAGMVDVAAYLAAVEGPGAVLPQAEKVYFTASASKPDVLRETRNREVREHCSAGKRILFDLEDIDSWSGGAEQRENGSPVLHTAYRGADGRINALGCENRARAFWWLLARLAGWDGKVPARGNDESGR